MNNILSNLLSLPRNEWDNAANQLSTQDKQFLESAADGMAVTCAEISAYFGARGANGCGDSGHDKAMKQSEAMRKKVRKALGYSYP